MIYESRLFRISCPIFIHQSVFLLSRHIFHRPPITIPWILFVHKIYIVTISYFILQTYKIYIYISKITCQKLKEDQFFL